MYNPGLKYLIKEAIKCIAKFVLTIVCVSIKGLELSEVTNSREFCAMELEGEL